MSDDLETELERVKASRDRWERQFHRVDENLHTALLREKCLRDALQEVHDVMKNDGRFQNTVPAINEILSQSPDHLKEESLAVERVIEALDLIVRSWPIRSDERPLGLTGADINIGAEALKNLDKVRSK